MILHDNTPDQPLNLKEMASLDYGEDVVSPRTRETQVYKTDVDKLVLIFTANISTIDPLKIPEQLRTLLERKYGNRFSIEETGRIYGYGKASLAEDRANKVLQKLATQL
jgi:hypothetical protein